MRMSRRDGPHPLAAHLAALWASHSQCVLAAGRLPEVDSLWHADLAPQVAALADTMPELAPGAFTQAVSAALLTRLEAVHRGLRAYQRHPYERVMPEVTVAARAGNARLLDYGGSGPPVVFVPSLVNPAWVLDLDEQTSMLRWLSTQNLRILLVYWGEPGETERHFDLDAYAASHLPALLAGVAAPVTLAGYCLGGTLALATACLMPMRVRALALLATPWDFSGYSPSARAGLGQLWQSWAPTTAALGAMPMDALQLAFAALDPTLMAKKFARFAGMDPDSAAARRFVALEDWANSGPPLAAGAARQAFERLFLANEPGTDGWRIDGTLIAPQTLRIPTLCVHAHADRLVPTAASAPLAARLAQNTTLPVAAGHVGMIVGGSARRRLWQPLAAWLTSHDATVRAPG